MCRHHTEMIWNNDAITVYNSKPEHVDDFAVNNQDENMECDIYNSLQLSNDSIDNIEELEIFKLKTQIKEKSCEVREEEWR